MSSPIRVYKIRRADGKFSTGGSCPGFTKYGKTWNRRCDAKANFDMIRRVFPGRYSGAEVVAFDLVEVVDE